MERINIENNLCECYSEDLGLSVWVQSDETGLWFNLNDLASLFVFSKKVGKKKYIDNVDDCNKIKISFTRNECKGEEWFVSESIAHDIITENKKYTNRAERFIYDIIMDYDNTCLNLDCQELNTNQRIALHAMQSECKTFLEKSKEYMDILKDTNIPEKYVEFEKEINKELKENIPVYDNKVVPVEVKPKVLTETQQKRIEGEKMVSKQLKNSVEILDEFIRRGKENYDEELEAEKRIDERLRKRKTNRYEMLGGYEQLEDDIIQADKKISEYLEYLDNTNKKNYYDEIKDCIELDWDDLL